MRSLMVFLLFWLYINLAWKRCRQKLLARNYSCHFYINVTKVERQPTHLHTKQIGENSDLPQFHKLKKQSSNLILFVFFMKIKLSFIFFKIYLYLWVIMFDCIGWNQDGLKVHDVYILVDMVLQLHLSYNVPLHVWMHFCCPQCQWSPDRIVHTFSSSQPILVNTRKVARQFHQIIQ